MDDSYEEFCKSAEKAKKTGRYNTFPLYGLTLNYDSEGIYNDGTKIVHLDLKRKKIQKLGHGSVMNHNHYIYAAHMFKICYDFREVGDTCDFIHVEHISYDDHT